jgi:hypothetical protein
VKFLDQSFPLDIEEVDRIYEDFCREGFEYSSKRENGKTNLVTLPNGRTFDIPAIMHILNSKLVFGNKNQIEALRAFEFYDFCTTYGC